MRFKLLILAAAAVAVAIAWSVFDSHSDQQGSQRQVQQLQATVDELKAELQQRPAITFGPDTTATRDVTSLVRREARAEAQRAINERSGTDEATSAKPPPVTFEQS